MPGPNPLAIRIPRDVIQRADRLRAPLARMQGTRDLPPSRHAVLLAAIVEGLAVLERQAKARK